MTTAAAQQDTTQPEEAVTVSGFGFRMVINGHDRPQIFDNKDELVVDVNERMAVQEKLVLPLVQKLGTSWKQELADLAAATQKVTNMSASVQGAFAATNDNQKKLQRGDQIEDGSYYAGVDEMGEDFFFWLESINYNQKPPVTTFNNGTKILRKKHQDGEVFHGHKFSSCQLDGSGNEDEIRKAIKDGTFDHGIHRPRQDQGRLIEQTLALKPELRAKALQVFTEDAWFQMASPYVNIYAWFQYLRDGEQYYYYNRLSNDASLLAGRSNPQRKLG